MPRGHFIFVRGLLLALSLYVAPGAASARTKSQVSSKSENKEKAPDLEDHANYFSEKRRGISPENLAKADALRRKSITTISSLLESRKKGPGRFELQLRLGELYVERHDYLRDLEVNQFEKSWESWDKSSRKGPEPRLDVSKSEAEMVRAANAFRHLVLEFPKHPRTDAALYVLGKTLARLGKDSAIDYYKQLIKSFPKSPLVADTYLSMGEWYFEKHQINEALESYKKVLDFKEHRAYPYAIYKLGWSYYNATPKNEEEGRENYKKAVAAFKLVVKIWDKDKSDGRNFNLREEAINDLIMVWAEAGDVDTAWNYFRTIGEQDAFYKMLDRLGNIYMDQGKNDKAIAVFQRLIKELPSRDGNLTTHTKILELYDLTNNIPAVVAELHKMHQVYLGSGVWAQYHQNDKKKLDEARRVVELNTHRYGAIFHQRGQKSKSEQYLRHAADVYALYLTTFGASENAYEIRFYLAEILFDFKKFETASDNYMIVAKAKQDGKYRKQAAFNAVGALNQLVHSVKWPAPPPLGKVQNPLEIPSPKQKLISAIDQYVEMLPKEKDGEPMRFTAAQIYFEYGHYPEAMVRFERITVDIPATKQARSSVKVILGFYSEKEDWPKVIAAAQGFAKREKLLDAELKKYIVDLLRTAMFKSALAYEKAEKYERAAQAFVEYQKEFPQDASADRALYNAMLNYFKVSRVTDAVTVGNLLLSSYSKSSLVPDTLASLATTYEALAKFNEAAQAYRKLAMNYLKDPRSPNALYNAAILYKGLKDINQAVQSLEAFIRIYPNNPLAAEVTLELASILEREGRTKEAIQAYTNYEQKFTVDRELALFAQVKAAVLKSQLPGSDGNPKGIEKVRRALMRKDAPAAYEARATLAGAIFKLAEPTFSKFMSLKIDDGSKLEKQITTKQSYLVRLARQYEAIIDLGGAEFTVASLYRLGEAHEQFAEALLKAPAPQGATPADVDRLKTELEKVAFPLREEANKFFDTAFLRSREVETFTTWTKKAYQKMVEITPDKYSPVDEMSTDPTYLGHGIDLKDKVLSKLTLQ